MINGSTPWRQQKTHKNMYGSTSSRMDFSFLYYYEFQIGSIDEIVELIVKVSDTECSLPYAQEMATQPLFF